MNAVSQEPGAAAAADRLLRMRRGEQVELRSGMDLTAVRQEMNELSPSGYPFVYGPGRSVGGWGHPSPDGREWAFDRPGDAAGTRT